MQMIFASLRHMKNSLNGGNDKCKQQLEEAKAYSNGHYNTTILVKEQ